MLNKKSILLLLGFGAVLTACSFVKLNPQAENITVAYNQNSITNCKFIGNTNVSIWSSADTFQSQAKVESQLDTLARNDASSMGGNTVYPHLQQLMVNVRMAYTIAQHNKCVQYLLLVTYN